MQIERKRIGLMIVALSGMEWWSVKKKKLFERSEFFFFSGNTPCSSGERAALTFCFFCVKAKEKRKNILRFGIKSSKHCYFWLISDLK